MHNSVRVWMGPDLPELPEDFRHSLAQFLKLSVAKVFEVSADLVEVLFLSDRIAIKPRSLRIEITYQVLPFQNLDYKDIAKAVNNIAQLVATMDGVPKNVTSVSCQILPENEVFFSEVILNK